MGEDQPSNIFNISLDINRLVASIPNTSINSSNEVIRIYILSCSNNEFIIFLMKYNLSGKINSGNVLPSHLSKYTPPDNFLTLYEKLSNNIAISCLFSDNTNI